MYAPNRYLDTHKKIASTGRNYIHLSREINANSAPTYLSLSFSLTKMFTLIPGAEKLLLPISFTQRKTQTPLRRVHFLLHIAPHALACLLCPQFSFWLNRGTEGRGFIKRRIKIVIRDNETTSSRSPFIPLSFFLFLSLPRVSFILSFFPVSTFATSCLYCMCALFPSFLLAGAAFPPSVFVLPSAARRLCVCMCVYTCTRWSQSRDEN